MMLLIAIYVAGAIAYFCYAIHKDKRRFPGEREGKADVSVQTVMWPFILGSVAMLIPVIVLSWLYERLIGHEQ